MSFAQMDTYQVVVIKNIVQEKDNLTVGVVTKKTFAQWDVSKACVRKYVGIEYVNHMNYAMASLMLFDHLQSVLQSAQHLKVIIACGKTMKATLFTVGILT